MNNVLANNQHAPASFSAILAGDNPILTKGEIKRIAEIAAAELAFNERRSTLSPIAIRNGIRARTKAFANGTGELPDQPIEAAESISKLALTEVRRVYNAAFDGGPREFLKSVYEKIIARARQTLAQVEERHRAEAAEFGLAFISPPVARSIEKAIGLLQRDAELLDMKDTPFPVFQLVCRKLGITPAPAAQAAPELAAA